MPRHIVRATLALVAVLAVAAPAFAIYPQQSTSLVGPAWNGVVPQGQAKVDQAGLPSAPGTLTLEVKDVNMPDGTSLDIELDGAHVGTVNLVQGQGKVSTTVPNQVGRHSVLKVGIGGVAFLTGVSPWKV